MADSKDIELTNTGHADHLFRDASGQSVTISPGETKKASVSPELHKSLTEMAEGGSPLVLAGSKEAREAEKAKQAAAPPPPPAAPAVKGRG